MGLIRLLLALSVITSHSTPIFGLTLVGGGTAVQTFYIISGFYMALILNEKYVGARSSYGLFLGSRLLRLLPVYWAVLIASILLQIVWPGGFTTTDGAVLGHWRDHVAAMTPGTMLFLAAANLFIFGQDALMFLGFDRGHGTLYLTAHYLQEPFPAYRFLFVPQAWTLGVELLFYVLAPFIVRRRARTIFLLLTASVLLRAVLIVRFGLRSDPWNYRFFPNELALFLMGALGYQLYRRLRDRKRPHLPYSRAALGVAVLSLVLFPFIPTPAKLLVYFPAMAFTFPWIFLMTQKSRLDRAIGDLSYPVYVSHWILAIVLIALGINRGPLLAALSIAVSIALLVFIDRPIDRLRQRLVESVPQPVPSPEAGQAAEISGP